MVLIRNRSARRRLLWLALAISLITFLYTAVFLFDLRLGDFVKWEVVDPQPKRYLIYLCDEDVPCYGLGDRQRSYISLYLLAIATNRTYGINMSRPSPLTDLYEPNMVPWVIKDSEIKHKSRTELIMIGRGPWPSAAQWEDALSSDVLFIRSNKNFMYMAAKEEPYKAKIPQMPFWSLYPWALIQLMRPTDYLRKPLNIILRQVASSMTFEFSAYKAFDFSICNKSCLGTGKEKCPTQGLVTENNNPNYCNVTPPVIQPVMSTKAIMELKGHDTANIGLICVHLRMGKSSTFHWEKRQRNKMEDLPVVWNFVKEFTDKGHHVYVATDSEEVRTIAVDTFGYRMHVNDQPIVHIDRVQKGQSEKQGFRLAAMEQLLLSTSCKVLLISYSNLSLKAASVRAYIQSRDDIYLFKNGKIRRMRPKDFI